ncbi:MAG: orotidine-5'-phosphate decarboxylase [Christensenellales bacterium]
MKIDALCEAINKTRCPVCAGLDTDYSYLPNAYRSAAATPDNKDIARSIFRFNCDIIEAVADIVPAVKVQAAYYEQYGAEGFKCFLDTMEYAKKANLLVIADVKRNDIGATAAAYAKAYIEKSEADFLTVNAYLGADGVNPFIDSCRQTGKGIFILVKTSNQSGVEFQDMDAGGKKLYEAVADKVSLWGGGYMGRFGYSGVGAVVGATYAAQARELRLRMPNTFFLVPGYGAQGAGARDIAVNFDDRGLGAVVNNSRGILLAYKKEPYAHLSAPRAARAAALAMKQDILSAL